MPTGAKLLSSLSALMAKPAEALLMAVAAGWKEKLGLMACSEAGCGVLKRKGHDWCWRRVVKQAKWPWLL